MRENTMKQNIEQRLQELKQEYTSGQQMMSELEKRQIDLRQTLLRIAGAVQVLEELLDSPENSATNDEEKNNIESNQELHIKSVS